MENKKIYIICPSRRLTSDWKVKIDKHVKEYEDAGYEVYLPYRDADQSQDEFDICIQNGQAMAAAGEIHVFYLPESSGVNLDLGFCFAMDVFDQPKRIVHVATIGGSMKNDMSAFIKKWINFRD